MEFGWSSSCRFGCGEERSCNGRLVVVSVLTLVFLFGVSLSIGGVMFFIGFTKVFVFRV